ncbi:hypothetical protein BCAH1134_C0505 (plasmid) [Bacillus cereus AH1134]|nr:hypothetical protein BCAH1134_C0505 [Bacillus cereus AH1134]
MYGATPISSIGHSWKKSKAMAYFYTYLGCTSLTDEYCK